MMKKKLREALLPLSLILGIISGIFPVPWITSTTQVIMELFLKMLKLISLPMIFLALTSTLTQMQSPKGAHTLLKTVGKYTILTTLIAATIGLFLFLTIQPTSPGEAVGEIHYSPAPGDYLSFLKGMIPENPIHPFLENNTLAVAFLSTILSFALLRIPKEKSRTVIRFFQGLFEVFLKIASALISIMPIAYFAFTAHFVTHLRDHAFQLQELFLYASCILGANLLQGTIVLPLMLKVKKQSPIEVARSMMPAITMAFFSKSSNATLPLTLQCAQNRLGISEKIARFSFPLCSIINMNGCAAFILITFLFVSSIQGMTFTLWQMVSWIFVSTLCAIGNAGVPMGCFFLTSALLMSMKIPIAMMGVILPLYSLFDMVETSLNVWSDICITTIVNREMGHELSP